jgi:hypothetical protein
VQLGGGFGDQVLEVTVDGQVGSGVGFGELGDDVLAGGGDDRALEDRGGGGRRVGIGDGGPTVAGVGVDPAVRGGEGVGVRRGSRGG